MVVTGFEGDRHRLRIASFGESAEWGMAARGLAFAVESWVGWRHAEGSMAIDPYIGSRREQKSREFGVTVPWSWEGR